MAEEQKNEEKVDVKTQEPAEGERGSEDMRAELMSKLEEVKNKNRALNSARIMGDNQTREQQIAAIQQLFGKMQQMGVDVNDPKSIQEFLDNLEQQDPDSRELFESAFNNLMSGIEK